MNFCCFFGGEFLQIGTSWNYSEFVFYREVERCLKNFTNCTVLYSQIYFFYDFAI